MSTERSATGARFASALRFMPDPIGRRDFVTAASCMLAVSAIMPRRRRAPSLRIGIPTSDGMRDSPFLDGGQLGADEATHSAALFGAGTVELISGRVDDLLRQNVVAVLGAEPSIDESLRLGDAAAQRGSLLVNVACADDSLRGDKCRAMHFHVTPSNAMLKDAVADARAQNSALAADARAVAWDHSLERFGADTLNNRFQARFSRRMTSEAWCAWVAVKILAEASLRARSIEPAAIAAYLRRETTQFDGHKGRPLSFRSWDNQLRQPVYVIAAPPGAERTLVIDSPASTADGGGGSSRDALDRIGTSARATTCRISP